MKEVFESFKTKREAQAYIQALKDNRELFIERLDSQIKNYEYYLEFCDLT